MNNKILKGSVYNISDDRHKLLKGWYVIESKKGDFYLVERSFSLSTKRKRSVYQTDLDLSSFRQVSPTKQPFIVGGMVATGIILSRFLVRIVPITYIFGEPNQPFNWFVAIQNVAMLSFCLSLAISLVFLYRKFRMQQFIKSQGKHIWLIGKIRNVTKLKELDTGRSFW